MPNEAAMTIDEGARARAFAQARRAQETSAPATPAPERSVATSDEEAARAFRKQLGEVVRQRQLAKAAALIKQTVGTQANMSQKATSWLSYTVWTTAVDNIPDTFGLSLLLLLYHDWHYSFKFFRIAPFHEFLCEPGADGMLGILPPSRVPLGIIQFLYKAVNYIGLFCFNLLLLLIATGIFIQFFLPLIIMAAVIQNIAALNIGELWDYFKALLSLV